MPHNKDKLDYGLLFVFIAVFIIINLKGLLIAQPGDENAYYYMGKLVSEGRVPYKDFFFAHPPFHIYLIALIYKVFGFNIVILKSIPLISTLISAIFIFCIAKNKYGSMPAIISSSLFLFSYSILFNSVFSFGIEVAAMFLVIGVYFLLIRRNDALAGIFFGLAGITRLLSIVPVAVIFTLIFLSNKKRLLRLLFGFMMIFLIVNGLFILFLRNDYLTPVYKYHLLKSFGKEENFKEYIDIIKLNWILFASALLFVFIKDKKQISIFAIVSVTYLLFLMALKKNFGFYFIVAFPFLAIAGGYSIVNIFRKLNLSKKWKIFISVILLLIFLWNLTSDILFLEKIGFKGFNRKDNLIDFINSASGKETLLFGDDSVVPLLALLTNKKIALDFVDTNDQVFISGVRDLNKVLNELKGKDVLFIIRSKQGISYFEEVRNFLSGNCEFLSQFHDKIEGDYIVYRCK